MVTVKNFNIRVRNPNVIMTVETNPEVMAVLYKYCSHSRFRLFIKKRLHLLIQICMLITLQVFLKEVIFNSFNEFEEFTGIKVIPSFCFSGCALLKEITLPESIEEIKQSAFQNSGLDSVVIPMNVDIIDQQAFESAKITSFTVDNRNLKFCSRGGNIYIGIKPEILYILAPAITEYTMPSEISIFGEMVLRLEDTSKLTKSYIK